MLLSSVALAAEVREIFWSKPENRVGRLYPLIAASIGPYGAYLADGSEYNGNYGISDAALKDFHASRMEILATSNADLLAFETIPCMQEAAILIELLGYFPQKNAWLSFSCKNGQDISSGEAFSDAVELANQSDQIVAVGLNCTAPKFVTELLKIAQKKTIKPLLAYPNRGEKWDGTHRLWQVENQDSCWFGQAKIWYESGARLIGGCCRTTPSDIGALRRLLI